MGKKKIRISTFVSKINDNWKYTFMIMYDVNSSLVVSIVLLRQYTCEYINAAYHICSSNIIFIKYNNII